MSVFLRGPAAPRPAFTAAAARPSALRSARLHPSQPQFRRHRHDAPAGLCRASLFNLPFNLPWPTFGVSPKQKATSAAVKQLFSTVEGLERGLKGSPVQRAAVMAAVDMLAELGEAEETTGPDVDATWRLLWTTEKETLFILANAGLCGTKAGEVFQVIDTTAGRLQNVITFPPDGAFIVNSSIEVASEQRVDFQFTGAVLKLPSRDVGLPPVGKGWFDNVYVDKALRVARDSRGDTLIVVRDGPPRTFE